MKYTFIGDTDQKVSSIGLGTWQFGTKGWGYGIDFDKGIAIKIVHRALDEGISIIDTAEVYGGGKSEKIIGEAIQGYDREKIVLTTKFFPIAVRPSSVERAVKRSLERLKTDYIDIYLQHWPNPILPLGRTLKNMEKLIDSGLIRYAGVSNFSTKRFKNAQNKMSISRLQVNQVNYSIAKNGVEKSFLPYAKEHKIMLMAYSPLAQGWLTGKYTVDNVPSGTRRTNRLFRKVNMIRGQELLNTLRSISEEHNVTMAQIALNYLISHPNVVAIPGAKSLEQLNSNIGAMDTKLSADEKARIQDSMNKFKPRIF